MLLVLSRMCRGNPKSGILSMKLKRGGGFPTAHHHVIIIRPFYKGCFPHPGIDNDDVIL